MSCTTSDEGDAVLYDTVSHKPIEGYPVMSREKVQDLERYLDLLGIDARNQAPAERQRLLESWERDRLVEEELSEEPIDEWFGRAFEAARD